MIRRPPRSTLSSSSAASDVYKRQALELLRVKDSQLRASMERTLGPDVAAELTRLQLLVEEKDRQLVELSTRSGDVSCEMARTQVLIKEKSEQLKAVMDRTVGPDMVAELDRMQQLLDEKDDQLQAALAKAVGPETAAELMATQAAVEAKDRELHEYSMMSDRKMRKMQYLLEEKDRQLKDAFERAAGPDMAGEMLRMQKLLQRKDQQLKASLERSVGPELTDELMNARSMLHEKETKLEEALKKNAEHVENAEHGLLELHEQIRQKDIQLLSANMSPEIHRLQTLLREKGAQLTLALNRGLSPGAADEMQLLEDRLDERVSQVGRLDRELKRMTDLLEEKDRQLVAALDKAASGPDLNKEMDALRAEAEASELELHSLRRMLEQKEREAIELQEALGAGPDVSAEMCFLQELLVDKDVQLQEALASSTQLLQEKERGLQTTLEGSSDLVEGLRERLKVAEAQITELEFELAAVEAEKENATELEAVSPIPKDTGNDEDWEVRCQKLEQRVRLQQKEQRIKMKRERWGAAERIFRGVQQQLAGNPLLQAFGVWVEELVDVKNRAKAQLSAMKMIVANHKRADHKLVLRVVQRMLTYFREHVAVKQAAAARRLLAISLCEKFNMREVRSSLLDVLGSWRFRQSGQLLLHSNISGGLRVINGILRKYLTSRVSVAVAQWSHRYSADKMHQQSMGSGLRQMWGVMKQWRHSLLKNMLLNWKAKKKVAMVRSKEKAKRGAAMEMMDKSTKDVQSKVMVMIQHSEAKADAKLKAAKKELRKLAEQVSSLKEENVKLRTQMTA
eukprot:TRINITY_DN6627_c0_g1_i17.p1 TRINITY_DN6627_c0_g1~~TRINITY_DN6627_c0_g1_i17.p1  ORF type:complete len:797 (-),score=301.01 TRINITY_DN6627_c0_g1_i17:119-2509(-)